MHNSLINYTNKEEIAVSRDAFKAYIELHSNINPDLSEADILLIKRCIEEEDIRVRELEKALLNAYKDPERYGKVEWNHVWKWVQVVRQNRGAELRRKYNV